MIVGIAGRKRSGKDTVARILRLYELHTGCIRNDIINDDDIEYMVDESITKYIAKMLTIDRPVSDMITSFAYKIKQITAIICNRSIEDIMSDNIKDVIIPSYIKCPLGNTFRHLFQYIGTEIGRNGLGKNVWIDSIVDELMEIEKQYSMAIISDVRFANEMKMLKLRQGVIIEIRSNRTNNNDLHESESLKDIEPDYIIENNSSIEDLVHKTMDVYKLILKNNL